MKEKDTDKVFFLFKSEILTNKIASKGGTKILIRVNDNDKINSNIIINKVTKGFEKALDIALRSETAKHALSNNKLTIILHDIKSYDKRCEAKFVNKLKEIKLRTNFDDLPFIDLSPQHPKKEFELLSALVFEIGNALNKDVPLGALVSHLTCDRDLFGLIIEYSEHNSCLIANKMFKEIIANSPKDENIKYLLWPEDFIQDWELSNTVKFQGKNAIAHTEYYRQRFDQLSMEGKLKISNFTIKDQDSLKELQSFIYRLQNDVTEMYTNKVKFLPEQEIFDKFISTLHQVFNNQNNENKTAIPKQNVSEELSPVLNTKEEENKIKISGELHFSEVSVEVDNIFCTLF